MNHIFSFVLALHSPDGLLAKGFRLLLSRVSIFLLL